jgi:hypothetical protein
MGDPTPGRQRGRPSGLGLGRRRRQVRRVDRLENEIDTSEFGRWLVHVGVKALSRRLRASRRTNSSRGPVAFSLHLGHRPSASVCPAHLAYRSSSVSQSPPFAVRPVPTQLRLCPASGPSPPDLKLCIYQALHTDQSAHAPATSVGVDDCPKLHASLRTLSQARPRAMRACGCRTSGPLGDRLRKRCHKAHPLFSTPEFGFALDIQHRHTSR